MVVKVCGLRDPDNLAEVAEAKPDMHRNHPKVIQTDIYIHCRNPITTFHNFFLAPFCALINNGGKDCSSPPFVALSIPFGTISLDTYRAMGHQNQLIIRRELIEQKIENYIPVSHIQT